jgi:hypothetical protein
MMEKEIVYDGAVFWTESGFSLYEHEDIDFGESKENIQRDFEREFKERLVEALRGVGLEFVRLQYFSPREYNFMGDSLDLVIKVKDRGKFKQAIEEYTPEIQVALDKNKSYDGFIATTVDSVEEELDMLKCNSAGQFTDRGYEPDFLVLSVILNKLVDFSGFSIWDSLVYEEEGEE